ncbi:MAG TPA: hypothetical protein VN706_06315 [Gemmatimonadaceae bacterium]|nr:hypothetical protein [Gemmatimonadaceae bacterium]
MRLDRKLLLIAPTIVLACVTAGIIYAAVQLHVLSSVGDTWKDRNDFITAVERGEKPLTERQAIGVLRLSLDVEARRTAAITASRDLLGWLAGIAAVACVTLAFGVRSVPREHWPRIALGRRADA